VYFERLWVEPAHARGNRWAVSMNSFLDARYGPEGACPASVLLLRPFPLEYEGAFDPSGQEPMVHFERRTSALRRLYARTLGTEGTDPEGWMWRRISGMVPEHDPYRGGPAGPTP
jgi:hypothetical protein